MTQNPGKIPNQFLFVWDDKFFPYAAYLAIRSVAMHAKPERIFLFKTPELDAVPNFVRLRREVECLEPVNIDLPGWLEQAGLPCTEELLDANRFLKERNFYGSVSDLLRSLNLYLRGGIYLDTDTLTLRDMEPLREHGAFLAEEHILVSSKVWKRNSRWRYFRTGPLTLVRDLCSRFALGVPIFQALSPLFVRVVHNAVMGCRPGHPLMRDVLLRIAERYPDRPKRYPLLGPDTVQDLIEENKYDDLTVLPPRCFSPLGPTMTFQYFHSYRPRTISKLAKRIAKEDTYAIHWSNNGTIAKSIPQSDEDLKKMQEQQLFARFAVQAAFPTGWPEPQSQP
jgi:Glycosyltransferase sugar-binding region containing DXD motif